VAAHDLRQRGLQARGVDGGSRAAAGRGQPERGEVVVEGTAWVQPVQEPEPLLPERERQEAEPMFVNRARDGRDRFQGARFSRQAARCGLSRADERGQPRNGRRLEDVAQRQVHMIGVAQPRDDLRREERVPAQLEEVIVDADGRDAQDFLPVSDNLRFERIPGGDIGRVQVGSGVARRAGRCIRRFSRRSRGVWRLLSSPAAAPRGQVAGRDDHLRQCGQREDAGKRGRALRRPEAVADRSRGAGLHRTPQHAFFGEIPAFPVHAQPRLLRTQAALLRGEGVQEAVRRSIGREPEPAEHGRERGHQQDEVERPLAERCGQRAGPVDLRCELRVAVRDGRLCHRPHRGRADDACGVNHAGQRIGPEVPVHLRQRRGHLFCISDVRLQDKHLAAERLELANMAHLVGHRTIGLGLRQERIPGLLWRQAGPVEQRQPGTAGRGEMLGQHGADAPQPAGDQVQSPFAQRHGSVCRLERLEHGQPAAACAIGHQRFSGRGVQFRKQMRGGDGVFRAVRWVHQVDHLAGDVRVLLRDDAARAQDDGALRQQRLVARDIADACRQDRDAERCAPTVDRPRTGQCHEAVEPLSMAECRSLGILPRVTGRCRPQVQDTLGQPVRRKQRVE